MTLRLHKIAKTIAIAMARIQKSNSTFSKLFSFKRKFFCKILIISRKHETLFNTRLIKIIFFFSGFSQVFSLRHIEHAIFSRLSKFILYSQLSHAWPRSIRLWKDRIWSRNAHNFVFYLIPRLSGRLYSELSIIT